MNVSTNPSSQTRPSSGGSTSWFQYATHPATVKRAFITALIVGTVLICINHGPAILNGQVTTFRIVQMCLTVFVPYAVSTISSVSTRRELATLPPPPSDQTHKADRRA